MKHINILFAGICFFLITNKAFTQNDTIKYNNFENGLVSLDGKEGVKLESKAGEFLFKPYILVQSGYNYNYYDDEGLSLTEQDNVLNSGFHIPYALIGFAGKAFDRVFFNLAINTAQSGGSLLNQAWFDVKMSEKFNVRIGKFKTPFANNFQVRLGQTLFHMLPSSLTTRVNLPFDINSVNPYMLTGFDIGIQLHGMLNNTLEYKVGVFNGTGITVNQATSSFSDDMGIPSMLYSGRLAYMPFGPMPLDQGSSANLNRKAMIIAVSSSFNVEANQESSNDLRAGLEFGLMLNKLYLGAEAYMMNTDFVERQQVSPDYLFWGGYVHTGYFVTEKAQPAIRFDLFDRNSTDVDGMLLMPAFGCNYFFLNHNLKLQAMYQMLSKSGHQDEFFANDDDNGMAEHTVSLQFQFTF